MLQNEITALQSSTAQVNNSLFLAQQPVSIPPGERRESDAINMAVLDNAELVISTYLPDDITGSESPMTYHVRALQTNYIAAGNQSGASDLAHFETTTTWHISRQCGCG